jgi:hypothetical protein
MIHTIGNFRLRFRKIDCRERRAVENHLWRKFMHHTKDSITVADIKLRLVERNDFNAIGCGCHKFARQLSAHAGDEYFSTRSRVWRVSR